MKRTLAIAALTLALMPGVAAAGERPADAALGALSGALVFGPVGLVAGAVVGYTAGPSISHGMRRGEPRRQARRASGYEARASIGEPQPAPQAPPVAAAPAAVSAPAPSTSTAAPPVQPLE
jgi:hypothetical protein